MAGTPKQFSQWTAERRAAHGAAIRRLHAAGRYATSEAYLLTRGRRKRSAGPYWPTVAEAARRLDAQRHPAAYRGTDTLPSQDPTWCLWTIGAVEYVPVMSDPQYVRDLRKDPIQGGSIIGWDSVHAARRVGERERATA